MPKIVRRKPSRKLLFAKVDVDERPKKSKIKSSDEREEKSLKSDFDKSVGIVFMSRGA